MAYQKQPDDDFADWLRGEIKRERGAAVLAQFRGLPPGVRPSDLHTDREAFMREYLCTPPFDDGDKRRRQTPNSPPVPKDDTQPPSGTMAIGGAP